MWSRRKAGFSALLAGALVAGVLLALTGVAGARTADKPGKGKGRGKVTLCHKGHTITVGAPAVRAHLSHGDTHGSCGAATPARGTATLKVIKHVVNDNGGTKTAADFTMTISGVNAVGGNSFAGSEAGVTKTLTSVGAYSVGESSPPGYALTGTSADCFGTIALGQHKTCTLTNDDLP
jgi:hypothetical protein